MGGLGSVFVAPARGAAGTTEDLHAFQVIVSSALVQSAYDGASIAFRSIRQTSIYLERVICQDELGATERIVCMGARGICKADLMPGTVRMPLLGLSATAIAAEGMRGLAPLSSSCLKSCSRMGSIFFGMVTSFPTARACVAVSGLWCQDLRCTSASEQETR